MITGIAGVTLWTANLEEMFRFYHDLLGLPLHSRHPDFIAFQLGEARFNLGRHSLVSGQASDPYRIMPHLAVSGIHQLCHQLQEAGVSFIRPPEQEHWGGWIATLQDPDGNVIQLLQLPD